MGYPSSAPVKVPLHLNPGSGPLRQRKEEREDLLIVKLYISLLVRVEIGKHFRGLLHEHARAHEPIKRDCLLSYLRTGG